METASETDGDLHRLLDKSNIPKSSKGLTVGFEMIPDELASTLKIFCSLARAVGSSSSSKTFAVEKILVAAETAQGKEILLDVLPPSSKKLKKNIWTKENLQRTATLVQTHFDEVNHNLSALVEGVCTELWFFLEFLCASRDHRRREGMIGEIIKRALMGYQFLELLFEAGYALLQSVSAGIGLTMNVLNSGDRDGSSTREVHATKAVQNSRMMVETYVFESYQKSREQTQNTWRNWGKLWEVVRTLHLRVGEELSSSSAAA